MDKFYNETLRKLEVAITELENEIDDSMVRIEAIIKLVARCLSEIKAFVVKRGFKNIEAEIHFFKHLKPIVVSKLIYYNAIYKIETKKPFGGEKTVKKYLNKEIEKLKRHFNNNLDFYKYYRTNSSYLDDTYFVRGRHDIKLSLDTYYFEADHAFSTSHDYKVAKIIANDLIQVYLEDQVNNIENKKLSDSSSVNWTGTKTALAELVYALHSQGVFNHGNTDIKLIAKTLETTFNITLGDFYHTFMELKARKINRTKFLDSLKESLLKKMEDDEW